MFFRHEIPLFSDQTQQANLHVKRVSLAKYYKAKLLQKDKVEDYYLLTTILMNFDKHRSIKIQKHSFK